MPTVLPSDRKMSKGRDKPSLPLLKIDLVNCEPPEESLIQSADSNVNLSVCIQDIPQSPTQHAEYTLALTPTSFRRKYRLRKQAVTDIHACFDVNDVDGAITVVDETDADPIDNEHCKRYERDSIDLLEVYDQLHPDIYEDGEYTELATLTSPNKQLSHLTRVNLLDNSYLRYIRVFPSPDYFITKDWNAFQFLVWNYMAVVWYGIKAVLSLSF